MPVNAQKCLKETHHTTAKTRVLIFHSFYLIVEMAAMCYSQRQLLHSGMLDECFWICQLINVFPPLKESSSPYTMQVHCLLMLPII